MMNLKRLAILPAALGLALSFVACGDDTVDPDDKSGTFYGEKGTLGNGEARTFVVLDADGDATEIGIRLTEDAMEGLTTDSAGTMLDLDIPTEASGTAFQFISVGWNPYGHEPEGIFTVPHFDLHFFTISESEVMAILPTDLNFTTKAHNIPDAKYIPTGFITPDTAAVPMMGVHWINPTDPSLVPGAFNEIMIYGTWDGKVNFIEPMITREWLMTKPTLSESLPAVQAYQKSGLWPTTYNVKFDTATSEYVISLGGLTEKTAS